MAYRLTKGVDYEAIPELRDSLLNEQGYICAYCMRRIPVRDDNSNETSRIEHIKSRTNFPHLKFDYNNMIICCPGAINTDIHCDKKKGDSNISFNIFDENFIDTIFYKTKNGIMESSNLQWNEDINEVLNLNNELLKQNRKAVIEGIVEVLGKNVWSEAQLSSQLIKWKSFDKEHKLKEYCGIVIWYLTQKTRK
jgi:uncharacterized protein (TIGR02646 family)